MEPLEELLASMPARIKMYVKDREGKYYRLPEDALLYMMKSHSRKCYEVFYRTVMPKFSDVARTDLFHGETLFEAVFNLKCYLKAYNDEVKSQLNEEIWIQ